MKNAIIGGLFCLVVPCAALASSESFKCDFPKRSGDGWIPEVVIVQMDAAAGSAVVYDPLIKHFIGKPLAAKISANNNKRTTWTWTVKATSDGNGQLAKMEYRLSHLKPAGKAMMVAQAVGYVGPYTAHGKCVAIKE